MSVGERIMQLRFRNNISQSDLAKEIGTSRSTISLWEKGASTPHLASLMRLAEFFHVSMDYLLERDNQEYINVEFLSPEEQTLLCMFTHYFKTVHGLESDVRFNDHSPFT